MDDDIPINLENILEQATRWTFAGDFTLLQWMKQISQDLESRATKTAEALAKLDNNVKSTNIALDNVANRLTTLQFGHQFVECRVQDDDETVVNVNEPSRDNQNSEEISSKELLNTFLNNNLKVLRNCHEKYSIDLDDSDDEENSKEKTCIYQPINPYNDRPLPYIFGSKDWHSKWHVGLYENQQENRYSGDELSEEFSESSSTSHIDDNESFESNTEWASSNSIDNDHLNANIEVKNASSLRGSQPLYPGTSLPINAAKTKATISESSSISTTSSALAKKSLETTKQNENLTQRSDSTNSINSKNSSKITAKVIPNERENVFQHKTQTQKFVDLFAEPAEDLESPSSVSPASNITRTPEGNRMIRKENPPVFKSQPPPFVDLFAEPPEDVVSSITSSMFSNQTTKRKTVNLFDNDDGKATKDDFLSALTKDEKLEKPKTTVKTSKSLFDDSDEDDDFLKAFIKRSSPKEATKSSLAKTLLFDNEIHESTTSSKLRQTGRDKANSSSSFNRSSNKKSENIFDDTEDNEDDLLFNKTTAEETKIPIQTPKMSDVSQSAKTSVPVTNLLNKPVVKEIVKKSVNKFNDFPDVNSNDNLKSNKISKKINLFDDVDEEDDLFSTKTKKNENISQQKTIKDVAEKSEKSMTTQEVDADKINKNQLKGINSILKEEHNETKHIVGKDHNIPEDIASEITENEVDTSEKNHTPPQKELNNNESVSLTQETLTPVAENITQKQNASNKYDFNSVLFSDEPPDDDDEFFETLAKTPNTLNSNYNVIDLENDIYEPELPKVPVANSSNNQTDTTDNFYTGLQLFSDIPPDDDTGGGGDTCNFVPDVNQTKRLHSVFYDDFNETLMALSQQHTEKQIPKNSVFSDEPPPINALPNSSSNDVTDHKVPDDKHEIISADYKKKNLEIDDKNTSESSNKRPVSKLQMPNININIQALLPGATNTVRKAKEDNLKSKVVQDDIKPELCIKKVSVGENEVTIPKLHFRESPRTAESEHILPNITKNRVKGPAARRPSTRRARQENYRKSLIEQQQSWESWDEKNETQNENINTFETIKARTKTSIPQRSSLEKEPNDSLETPKQNLKDQLNDKFNRNNASNVTSSTSKLFENKYYDDPKILQNINIKNNDENLNNFKEIQIKTKSKQGTASLLFDDDEEDDDFFKHIKTANILDSSKVTNVKVNSENITSKSLETSEGNAASSSILFANNTNFEVTKEITTLQSQEPSSLGSATEVAPSETTTKEFEKNQTSPDIETAKVKPPSQLKTKEFKSFLDSEDDDNDLFKATFQQPTRSNDKNIKAKAQFKSFLDSETDEESNVAGLQVTTSTPSTIIPSTEIPKAAIRTPKKSNAKIFSDSETDSDDLFGKISSTKTSNIKTSTESTAKTQNKAQPQSSLFDSGESDSDDFLTSSGSVSKKTASKSALMKNVPKTITQTNTSLFSDLDSDEDDLFGGASAKVTTNATIMKNVKAPSRSKPTESVPETSKSKTVDDNPLADLL